MADSLPNAAIAGRIAFVAKGEWQSGNVYTYLDVVSYEGASYVCRKNMEISISDPPSSNTEYWQQLITQTSTMATTSRPGIVQPDGTSIFIDEHGVISCDGGVTSWNNRSGSIIPVTGDYNDSQIVLSSILTIGGTTPVSYGTDKTVHDLLKGLCEKIVTVPVAIGQGGTGNVDGYIRTGHKPTTAIGTNATIEGELNEGSGKNSHAEGYQTKASGDQSRAEGYETEALGADSHSEGYQTTANVFSSHAEGWKTQAGEFEEVEEDGEIQRTEYGQYSHTEGKATKATGEASHAEGISTQADPDALGAHAEGYDTHVTQPYAHVEGYKSTAEKQGSHAEGNTTHANGEWSHAEGYQTETVGDRSHAEGDSTKTGKNATAAHAEGFNTIANHPYQHVQGKYNKNKENTLFEIGNGTGTDDAHRHNAFEVYENGDINISGQILINDVPRDIWTDAVQVNTGAVYVDVFDDGIKATSMIAPYAQTESGKVISYYQVNVEDGEATIIFPDALEEAADIKLHITNIE